MPGADSAATELQWQPMVLGLDKRRLLAEEVMLELTRGGGKPAVAQLAQDLTHQLEDAEAFAQRHAAAQWEQPERAPPEQPGDGIRG